MQRRELIVHRKVAVINIGRFAQVSLEMNVGKQLPSIAPVLSTSVLMSLKCVAVFIERFDTSSV